MEIYGIVEKRSKIIPLCCLAMASFAIANAIQTFPDNWLFFVFALFLIVMVFYKNTPVITDEGTDEIMSVFALKRHSRWKWEDIDFIFANMTKEAPNAILILRKGKASRRIVIGSEYVQQVFDAAAEKNEKIVIKYNGNHEFRVKNMTTMSEADYKGAQAEADPPKSFHELANELRKIKAEQEREQLLKKPDFRTVKVVRSSKKLKEWK